MYAWKCWRDSRDRVILYGTASLAVGIMLGVMSASWYRVMILEEPLRRRFVRDWNPALWAWTLGITSLNDFLWPAALWAALILAATSVGREYGSGAMPFLLTRPARRWNFVWTDWRLGMTQMVVISALMLVGALPFFVYTSRAYVGRSWPLLPGCVILPAALYGLAHFMTALTGSSMKGLSATAAAILLYELLPGALDEWWHIHGPLAFRDWSLNVLEWDWTHDLEWDWTHDHYRFLLHGWPMLMWLVVAMAFPLLSQIIVERREV